MQKIIMLAFGLLLFLQIIALAQETNYEAVCAKECNAFTKDCTAYIECKVARSDCLESCMQRKVWENVAKAVDRLTVVLEKQAKEKVEIDEKEKNPPLYSIVPLTPVQIQNSTQSQQRLDSGPKNPENKE